MKRISRSKSIFYITRVSLLASISIVLMYFETPLPIFPEFYKIDFSAYPVLIGTFAMGPVAGVTIQFIKDIVHLLISNTSMGVGQLADFIVGVTYILPAGIIYHKLHTKKGAVIGTVTGTVMAVLSGCLLNYFVFIPLFAKVFNVPVSAFVGMGNSISKYIVDLRTFVIFATLPFNILKFCIISSITLLTYKKISPIICMLKKDGCR